MFKSVRLLILGYGLAGVAAAVVSVATGAVLAPILLFWIGGAVAVLAIAAVRAAIGPVEARGEDANVALEDELAAWEADRRRDSEEAAARAEAERAARYAGPGC